MIKKMNLSDKNNGQCHLYLKNSSIFSLLPGNLIKKICGKVDFVACPKSCNLYSPFEPAIKVYVVNSGEVQLYHLQNGKKFVFDTLGAGSVFGNVGMGEVTYGHFAATTPGASLSMMSTNDFMQLLQTDSNFMLAYTQSLSGRIREYQQQLQNMNASAEELILHELHRLQEKRKSPDAIQKSEKPLRLTHKELAEMTGLNRVTVTRSINSLKAKGDLQYDEKTGAIELLF